MASDRATPVSQPVCVVDANIDGGANGTTATQRCGCVSALPYSMFRSWFAALISDVIDAPAIEPVSSSTKRQFQSKRRALGRGCGIHGYRADADDAKQRGADDGGAGQLHAAGRPAGSGIVYDRVGGGAAQVTYSVRGPKCGRSLPRTDSSRRPRCRRSRDREPPPAPRHQATSAAATSPARSARDRAPRRSSRPAEWPAARS